MVFGLRKPAIPVALRVPAPAAARDRVATA